jgi:hypothetical protein
LPQEIGQNCQNRGVRLRFAEVAQFFEAYLGLSGQAVETRVRLLRRAGVPMLGPMLTGPAKHYGLPQLVQMTFAMELIEEGVSIAEAAAVARRYWETDLARAFDRAWRMNAKGDEDAVLLVLYRTSFRGWGTDGRKHDWSHVTPNIDEGSKYAEADALEVVLASQFAQSDLLKPRLKLPTAYGRHRAYLINCTQVSRAISKLLHAQWVIDGPTSEFLYGRLWPAGSRKSAGAKKD